MSTRDGIPQKLHQIDFDEEASAHQILYISSTDHISKYFGGTTGPLPSEDIYQVMKTVLGLYIPF